MLPGYRYTSKYNEKIERPVLLIIEIQSRKKGPARNRRRECGGEWKEKGGIGIRVDKQRGERCRSGGLYRRLENVYSIRMLLYTKAAAALCFIRLICLYAFNGA